MIKNHFVRKSVPELGNYMENGEIKFYNHAYNVDADNLVEIDEDKMEVKSNIVITMKFKDKEDFQTYLKNYKNTFELNGFVEAD